MMRAFAIGLLAALAAPAGGCGGTTGSGLVTFAAAAAGPADLPGAGPLAFDTAAGFHVTLQRAVVHVGALYLNASAPISGAQETSCTLPGVYIAEVTRGRDVDLLDPAPQPFPVPGEGKADPAAAGEVWLMGTGDVNAQVDMTPILDVAGTAAGPTATRAFSGTITISTNRAQASPNPAQPGARPLCKQRIVTPIATDVVPRAGGTLVMRADPRKLFDQIDFDDADFLAKDAIGGDVTTVVFDDASATKPSRNLYEALRGAATYAFEWIP